MTIENCNICGEIKSLKNSAKNKTTVDGFQSWCRKCTKEHIKKLRNTDIGYLQKKYNDIKDRCRKDDRKCYFTFDEFLLN
jgi:hypothetical protein